MKLSLSLGGPDLLTQSLQDHWRLFLAEGLVLSLLGLCAIVAPLIAGLAATVFFGWILLITGLAGLAFTVSARRVPGFGWSLLSALIAVAAGGMLLWNPLAGLVTLTYVLVAFFIIDGAFMIMLALDHRRELSARWEWILINGLVDLFLAGVILTGLPGAFLWAFGVLIGVDMLFGGGTLAAMALSARKTVSR